MKKTLALIPLVLLVAACGKSNDTAAATQTVTVTATVTATASAVSDQSAATDPSTSTGGPAAPDACSLLTPAQAEKVAGTALMKPVSAGKNSSGGAVECEYTGPTSGPVAQVEVYVGDGAKQQLHIERDNLEHRFMTVAGVGDQCVQEDGYIFVQKNGLWASIHLVRLNDPKLDVAPMQAGITQLAARLP